MPLGAARITLLAFQASVEAEAEVIRKKIGITAVGNAQVDTAQSKFGGASALFDGTGDYLQIPNSSDFDVTGGDFTAEAWVRATNNTSIKTIFGKRSSNQGWWLVLNSGGPLGTGQVQFVGWNGSTSSVIAYSDTIISTNTWYHIAIVKDGSNFKLFVNGALEDTQADSGTLAASSNPLLIGRENTTSTRDWNGHLDEVRISNTARYTTTFTPSTTPFVNDDNTLLLLHMDGTDASTYFEDDNGARAQTGITAVGANVSTTQSKFGGASAYFDGTSTDYISYNTYQTQTGDLTLEGWIRFDALPSTGNNSFMTWWLSNASNYVNFRSENNKIQLAVAGKYGTVTLPSTIAINTWYHLAVVRSSGTFKVYWNGTDCGAFANDSGWPPASNIDWSGTGQFGKFTDARGDWQGYMDEIRISNTARYTTGFTPSTTPFVNDNNTLLLLHMDGTDGSTVFRDDNGVRAPKGISAVGNAQIDTAQSKFGGSSALFDGTGDALRFNGTGLNWGTGDFTVEAFINVNTLGRDQNIVDLRTSGSNHIAWGMNSSRYLYLFDGTFYLSSSATVPTGFAHVALTRSSGTMKYWINGSEVYSSTNNANHTSTGPYYIGSNYLVGDALSGHIDEVRISNTARYTAAFTPPVEPFQNDANTLLLLHMDGTDGSTTFVDDNGVEGVNVVLDPPLNGILVNAGARIQALSITNAMSSTSRQGTYSFWYKDNDFASRTATQLVYVGRTTSDTYLAGVSVWVSTSGLVTFYGYRGINNGWIAQQGNTSASALNDGNWHHIAYSYNRPGTPGQLYIDGVSVAISNTRYNDAPDGNDFIARRFIGSSVGTTTNADPFSVAQIWYDDTRIDLSTNIDKFYNAGPVDLGTDGTATGLAQPAVYHNGNTSTFYTNNGRTSGTTYMTYTLSVGAGSISDTTVES